jgi:hypothetical protein
VADDELERFEALLGAFNSSLSGEDDRLEGAKCPKCQAASFIRVSQLYEDAVHRLGEHGDDARGIVLAVAVPLAAIAFYVYRRFGESIGQAAIGVAIIVTVIVFLTSLRRLSDDYYARRNEWNKLYMCRRCGQLVAS